MSFIGIIILIGWLAGMIILIILIDRRSKKKKLLNKVRQGLSKDNPRSAFIGKWESWDEKKKFGKKYYMFFKKNGSGHSEGTLPSQRFTTKDFVWKLENEIVSIKPLSHNRKHIYQPQYFTYKFEENKKFLILFQLPHHTRIAFKSHPLSLDDLLNFEKEDWDLRGTDQTPESFSFDPVEKV